MRKQPQFVASLSAANQALTLVAEHPDSVEWADAKRIRAIALRHTGRDLEALEDYQAASAIYSALGLDEWVARCTNNASHIYRDRGEYQRSVIELEEAIARVSHLDGPWKSMLFTSLGMSRRRVGDREGAVAAHEEALVLARRWKQRGRICAALSNLASSKRAVGALDEARALYDEAIEIAASASGLTQLKMNTFINLSHVERESGDYEKALALASEALTYFRRRRPQRRTGAYVSLGRTYAAMGEHGLALRHLRLAHDYYRARGHELAAARIRFRMGEVVRAQHPSDPRTLRRVLRYWVPAYIALERARFQFPSPAQRRAWHALTAAYRVPLFEVAHQLGDSELVADLVETAIHSGAYGTGGAAGGEPEAGADELLSPPSEADEDAGGHDSGSLTLGSSMAAIAGSTLPMLPTPPLTAPYGRLRLGRYRTSEGAGARLRTW